MGDECRAALQVLMEAEAESMEGTAEKCRSELSEWEELSKHNMVLQQRHLEAEVTANARAEASETLAKEFCARLEEEALQLARCSSDSEEEAFVRAEEFCELSDGMQRKEA